VLYTGSPEAGVDMYVGQGGAPEGVLAAAALRCVGGQMQARLVIRNEGDRHSARRAGIDMMDRRFCLDDLVSSETIFAATGVTKGGLLEGAVRNNGTVTTWTLIMSSVDGVSRTIKTTTPVSA
jgi:fructose-1,6-bisphosphatase II / sedoheptulose-1,7-bisphosphatase